MFAGKARFDCRDGDDEEGEEEERNGAHCPCEAYLGDEMRGHNGDNDASQTASRGHDAVSSASFAQEELRDCARGGVEDAVETQGAADCLGQDELIILGTEGRHHEAEDVEKGTEYQKILGSVVVKGPSDNLCSLVSAVSLDGSAV